MIRYITFDLQKTAAAETEYKCCILSLTAVARTSSDDVELAATTDVPSDVIIPL